MTDRIIERFPVEQALDRSISQHDQDDGWYALTELWCGEMSEIHQDVLDLQGGLILETATGWHLEQHGDRLGEPKGPDLTDVEYARFIAARMLTTASSGTWPQLVEILSLLVDADVLARRVADFQMQYSYTHPESLTLAARARVLAQIIGASPNGTHIGPITHATESAFSWDGEGVGWGGTWIEAL